MIKFFRGIREKMLSENRFRRYLMYSIGEIILVVIGILIAIQINNWNETRKDVNTSKLLLHEFRKDLERDISESEYVLGKLENQLALEAWSLDRVTYDLSDMDSLRKVFFGTYYQQPISIRTFSKLQNSENPNLTGFTELQNELTRYYTETKYLVDAYNEEEKYMAFENEVNNLIRTKLEINLPGFPILPGNNQYRPFIDFAQSVEGRNYIKNNYKRRTGMKKYFTSVKEEAFRLIDLIDRKLETAQ
jgi:hypothetical protein